MYVGIQPLLVGSRGLIERLSLAAVPASRVVALIGEDGMRQNALLQSVKGSGPPSTARKEDRKAKLKVAVSTAAESRQEFASKDHFAVRIGVRCAGVHLIVDLHGGKRLNDIDHIEATLRRCIEASRATL